MYTFVIESSCLCFEPCVNAFFELVFVVEVPANKEGFQMLKQMIIVCLSVRCKVWAVWWVVKLVAVKGCQEFILVALCGQALSWIKKTPWASIPRLLDHALQFCKHFTVDI